MLEPDKDGSKLKLKHFSLQQSIGKRAVILDLDYDSGMWRANCGSFAVKFCLKIQEGMIAIKNVYCMFRE